MNRRKFLTLGLVAVCAPAIVRASSLMPVSVWGQPSGVFVNMQYEDAAGNVLRQTRKAITKQEMIAGEDGVYSIQIDSDMLGPANVGVRCWFTREGWENVGKPFAINGVNYNVTSPL